VKPCQNTLHHDSDNTSLEADWQRQYFIHRFKETILVDANGIILRILKLSLRLTLNTMHWIHRDSGCVWTLAKPRHQILAGITRLCYLTMRNHGITDFQVNALVSGLRW